MCHLIVPKICGTPGFTEKSVFRKVHGQCQERMIGNRNPESGFFPVLFSLLSPRMCHLIVPKDCGTPGFTEKDRFSNGFKSNLKKEFANTILNPVFVKVLDFWPFFVAIVQNVPSDCSLKFAGLQDSPKKKHFSKGSRAIERKNDWQPQS